MPRYIPKRSLITVATLPLAILLGGLWFDSHSATRRLIFLPGGDAGLGFKSADGYLQRIEYAPWDPANLDSPWWSVPYRDLVLGCVAVALSFWVVDRCRARMARTNSRSRNQNF